MTDHPARPEPVRIDKHHSLQGSTTMFKRTRTILATTAVAAGLLGSASVAHAGLGIPQGPGAQAGLGIPQAPTVQAATDLMPGPSVQAATDLPPGPTAQVAAI